MRDIDANYYAAGNKVFIFIGLQAFHKRAGELRTSGSLTQGDVDGNGTADFEIQVNVARSRVTSFSDLIQAPRLSNRHASGITTG